jgi:hypothetical protein
MTFVSERSQKWPAASRHDPFLLVNTHKGKRQLRHDHFRNLPTVALVLYDTFRSICNIEDPCHRFNPIFVPEKFLQAGRKFGGEFLPGKHLAASAKISKTNAAHDHVPAFYQIRTPLISDHTEAFACVMSSEHVADDLVGNVPDGFHLNRRDMNFCFPGRAANRGLSHIELASA